MDALPDELLGATLSFSSARALLGACCVSRSWRRACADVDW